MSADAIDDEWWLEGGEEQPEGAHGRKRKVAAAVVTEELGGTKQKRRRRKKSKLEDIAPQQVGATIDKLFVYLWCNWTVMQASVSVFVACTNF